MYQEIKRSLDLAQYYNRAKDSLNERLHLEKTRDAVNNLLSNLR